MTDTSTTAAALIQKMDMVTDALAHFSARQVDPGSRPDPGACCNACGTGQPCSAACESKKKSIEMTGAEIPPPCLTRGTRLG